MMARLVMVTATRDASVTITRALLLVYITESSFRLKRTRALRHPQIFQEKHVIHLYWLD